MLIEAYKYLYYRVYAWNLRVWGESDVPQFNALFFVIILALLNLMSIPTAIDAFTGGHLIKDSGRNKLILAGVGLVISLISYFLLVHDRKYKEIAKAFSVETPVQKRRRLIAIWLYLIGTFTAFFGFLSMLNR